MRAPRDNGRFDGSSTRKRSIPTAPAAKASGKMKAAIAPAVEARCGEKGCSLAQPRTGAPERRGRNKGALAALERSNEVLSAIAGAQGRFIESGASPDALDALLRLVLRTSGCRG